MRILRSSTLPTLAAATLLAASCSPDGVEPVAPDVPSTVTAEARRGPNAADPVVVTVGRNHLGTDFPPASHDGSFHAKDAIRPRAIVIDAGTTVKFVVNVAHTAAVYEPGIEPEDIDLSTAVPPGFPFPPVINDPEGRLATSGLNTNFGDGLPIELTFEFTEPGRYLVICEVLPHFVEGKMYAWVDVK